MPVGFLFYQCRSPKRGGLCDCACITAFSVCDYAHMTPEFEYVRGEMQLLVLHDFLPSLHVDSVVDRYDVRDQPFIRIPACKNST